MNKLTLFALITIAFSLSNCRSFENEKLTKIDARWQLYKFNLMAGDSLCQVIPINDSILHNGKLYEYDLTLDTILSNNGAEVNYIFFFDNGIAPCHTYYTSIRRIEGSKDSIVLNLNERGHTVTTTLAFENEFAGYLSKIPVALMSDDLAKLAKDRGISLNE